MTAQIWTGLTFGWTWAPSAAAPPSGSVTEGAFFLSDSPLLMTLSPSRSFGLQLNISIPLFEGNNRWKLCALRKNKLGRRC